MSPEAALPIDRVEVPPVDPVNVLLNGTTESLTSEIFAKYMHRHKGDFVTVWIRELTEGRVVVAERMETIRGVTVKRYFAAHTDFPRPSNFEEMESFLGGISEGIEPTTDFKELTQKVNSIMNPFSQE